MDIIFQNTVLKHHAVIWTAFFLISGINTCLKDNTGP